MTRISFLINPDDNKCNIYNNIVLKTIVTVFYLKVKDLLLLNKGIKVIVYLKAHDIPNLKPRFYKEIKVHEFVLDGYNIHLLYLDLERKLHSYPNFKMYWKDVKYLAFDYSIIEY
jgi:hypothetical protein